MEVANVGPMFVSDKPRLSMIRFQGEGDGPTLANLLKSGLNWMGEARSNPRAIAQPGTQPAR
jgi:hypothetical protein